MYMMNHTFLNHDHMENNRVVKRILTNNKMLWLYALNTLKIPENNRKKNKNMKMYNKDEDCVMQRNKFFLQIITYIKDV